MLLISTKSLVHPQHSDDGLMTKSPDWFEQIHFGLSYSDTLHAVCQCNVTLPRGMPHSMGQETHYFFAVAHGLAQELPISLMEGTIMWTALVNGRLAEISEIAVRHQAWQEICRLWCRWTHPAPMVSIQGHYVCPKCTRSYEVPWTNRKFINR